VWTGVPADTPSLVARVRALREDRAADYDAIATRLADAASQLIDALGATGDAPRAVAAVRAGGEAVAALGEAAGCALWTDAHTRIRELVEPYGAAVKPTGAGGGDVALIACASAEQSLNLRAAMAEAGIPRLPLRVDLDGVELLIDGAPAGA